MRLRGLLLAVGLLGCVHCGAKTGLIVPDASFDASDVQVLDAMDAIDVPADVPPDGPVPCIPGQFTLQRFTVDLMLVIDRSGSMDENIDGEQMVPPRKWDDLRLALANTLPAVQNTVNIGAYAFPARFDGSQIHPCEMSTSLDVSPGLNHAADVLAIFSNTDPSGNTPTDAAIQFVGDLLVSRISRTNAEVMVLATDGGPNCNGMLNGSTCPCTAPTPVCVPDSCLDDARTATTIAHYASLGVPTYVIGLDTAAMPDERMALSEMATAGGRPNTAPGQPAYYSAQRQDEVMAAFGSITRSIAQCTLATPSRPADPSAIVVQINGVSVPRDPTHTNGWDWNDATFGQIAFFGAACNQLGDPTAMAIAIVNSCPDGG